MGFYVLGHLNEHIYTLQAKTIEDLMARNQLDKSFKSKYQVAHKRKPCGTLKSDLTRRKAASET